MEIPVSDQIKRLFSAANYAVAIYQLEIELESVPNKIAGIEERSMQSNLELETGAKKVAETEKIYREKEATLADSVNWIMERESKLYKIKTNKEYQAATKEIAERKKINKELENEILALMGEIEKLQGSLKERRTATETGQKEGKEKKGALEARENEIRGQLEDEKKRWEEKTDGIDPKLLSVFDSAKRTHKDVLAFIENGACQGCCLSIPPQLVIEVMKLKNLHTCPNCQRLLFVKETVEKKQEEEASIY